jgi:hypothetical protein
MINDLNIGFARAIFKKYYQPLESSHNFLLRRDILLKKKIQRPKSEKASHNDDSTVSKNNKKHFAALIGTQLISDACVSGRGLIN